MAGGRSCCADVTDFGCAGVSAVGFREVRRRQRRGEVVKMSVFVDICQGGNNLRGQNRANSHDIL